MHVRSAASVCAFASGMSGMLPEALERMAGRKATPDSARPASSRTLYKSFQALALVTARPASNVDAELGWKSEREAASGRRRLHRIEVHARSFKFMNSEAAASILVQLV